MSEQRERLQRSLQDCAELGVPETVDLWKGVEERISSARRRSRRTRLVPRTRIAWAVAALIMLTVASTGAYAAPMISEIAYDLFRTELPGARDGDVGVPIGGDRPDGSALGKSQTAHGAKVTLERAYTDQNNVVVSFSLQDLHGERRIDGKPAQLRVGDVTLVNDSYKKTGVTKFSVGGPGFPDKTSNGPFAYTAIIRPSNKMNATPEQRFRVAIPLENMELLLPDDSSGNGTLAVEPVGEPFIFDFAAPVDYVPSTEVTQDAEANGVALTLERVEGSPGRPEAIICFQPPDDDYSWQPIFASEPLSSEPIGNGCWAVTVSDPIDKYYSLTVDEIQGIREVSRPPKDSEKPLTADTKTISGPWRFDFKMPEK